EKKETRVAPTKDPRTGIVEVATLESGPGAAAEAAPGAEAGAGAGAESAARTALIEAAATMTAQEIFFMSMVLKNRLSESLKNKDEGEVHFIGEIHVYFKQQM
ncbi:hypothetical protein Gotri_023212, partial [Gossypium trilobum]|nr:hypothetical protein [Gossypium trilobum]